MWFSGEGSGQSDPVWPDSGGAASNPNQPVWPNSQSGGSGGWGGPSPAPTPTPTPALPSTPAGRRNLTVPHRMNILNGAYDGQLFAIKGVIKPNAKRFVVDICTKGDIAFHFNPRFNDGGRQVIVRNSCRNKKWDKEERELSGFPFVPGEQFEMEILCTSSEYKVSVNGSPLLTFKHRISDLRSISSFCIYHDLDLISVDLRTQ
ncbi:galectin-5-like [Salarias fasciatus]|uniref:galectin-5-like n=1 Tax=Salarias fasciatus TaxID=181472 RepID=UPI00117671AF|nr:galectin-5-like [Salarias fasciatus]